MFTIETLNDRIKHFEYGLIQISNKPGSIKLEHIQQKKLRMTAREALCLLEYFLCFIGDLIPLSEPLLEYVHTLEELVEL